jgi:hypothetical protein
MPAAPALFRARNAGDNIGGWRAWNVAPEQIDAAKWSAARPSLNHTCILRQEVEPPWMTSKRYRHVATAAVAARPSAPRARRVQP